MMSRFCVGAELAAATQTWQRIVEGLEESGAEAELRATERVRQAALPLYANLFTLISNQPAGEIGCPRAACRHDVLPGATNCIHSACCRCL